jgi:sporadic carbohydrate cluster protein (TIGR04323 family)
MGDAVDTARKNRAGYRGYVTCRPFGGLHVPVPLQTLAMRDYCARNGFTYKLHDNENIFPHSYLVLEGMVNMLDLYEGILATSIFMMPKDPARRRRLYNRMLEQGGSLHFVLEDMAIRKSADIEPIEEILLIHHLLPTAPRTIDDPDAVPAY